MMSKDDFSKKQILFVFFTYGEKMSFQNENIIVKNQTGKTIIQCSCYRIFLIYAVGNWTLTNVVIEKANKYGFQIACLTNSFRLYAMIGNGKEGNTLLHQKQYSCDPSLIASHIVRTKLISQCSILEFNRKKSQYLIDVLNTLRSYITLVSAIDDISSLRGYE